jgi:hypothetical protein
MHALVYLTSIHVQSTKRFYSLYPIPPYEYRLQPSPVAKPQGPNLRDQIRIQVGLNYTCGAAIDTGRGRAGRVKERQRICLRHGLR